MSFLKFADDAAMYDSTPLDNMFIIENLPSAPEAFLKVYIYARMLCMHPELGGIEELSRALRLDMDVIDSAFAYWERAGFVRRVADNPPQYVMLSVRGGTVNAMDRDYYKYRDFNGELQALFPAGKLMHPAQYAMANDWLNVLGFSQDAAIELVRGTISLSRSKNPDPARIFKAADKRAAQLADAGVTDVEGVKRELAKDERVDALARELTRQFGMLRAPSMPEQRLAAKWLNRWGLAPEDVLEACDATVKAHNPTFAYLDTILENRRSSNGSYGKMQEIFRAMGAHRQPAPEQCRWYEELLEEGFEHGTIELAAKQQSRRASPSFEGLDFLLGKWRERGLYKYADAEEFVTRGQALLGEFNGILRAAGIEKKPTEDDLTAYESWKQALPIEMIQFAAESAAGRSYPVSYMRALIERWQATGIDSLEAAKAAAASPATSRPAAQQKPNPALDYEQREYRDEDFDGDAFMEEARRMMEQNRVTDGEGQHGSY